ncbi:MAG TPA: hypothetical protein VFZ58_03225 [Candidatus Saccharimonadales bacterium]
MEEKPQNYWQPASPEPSQPVQTQDPAPQAPLEQTGPSEADISWRASEYVHHDKGFLWYVVLGATTLAGTGLAAFLQQWIFAALILIMGIAVGVYAKRPPREISYSIAPDGVYVNNQLFLYGDFRSFGIVDDGAFFALQLRPTKRFMPAVTMYFTEADGERIVDALSQHLPMEELKIDLVDKFMRWLRF